MSALVLEPRKLKSKSKACDSCTSPKKTGTHRVEILGYPVGVACRNCAKELRKVWDEALGMNIA